MRISDWSSDVCSSDLPEPQPRILLVDRPKSPQSIIMAGKVLGVKGGDHLEILRAANEVSGGSFLSRFNMNLRETKGWSYGVYSQVSGEKERLAWVAVAPVRSEEHTSELQSLMRNSYAVFGL